MAKENILLPAMSDQMTDAELLSWKISAGDKVNKGDILCEISTDKVDMDLDSPFTGEILSLKVEEGDVCLLYTSPSPRDRQKSRMPSSA